MTATPTNIKENDLFSSPVAYKDVDRVVNKVHLKKLEHCPIIPCRNISSNIAETACFFQIKRVVLDQKEDILQKLASVYAGAGSVGANLAMIIRGYSSGETEIYLGVCNEKSRINGAYPKARVLYDSFIGNFPGCRDDKTFLLNTEDTRVLLNKCYDPEYNAVAGVSCISSLRNKNEGQNSGFYQGLDKLIETMSGKDYSVVILARPLDSNEIESVCTELEEIYSRLSPYSKVLLGANWSDAKSLAKALSKNLSVNVTNTDSASLSVGKNHNVTNTENDFSSEYSGFSGGVDVNGINFGYNRGSSTGHGTGTAVGDGQSITEALSKISSEGTGISTGTTLTGTQTQTIGESIQLTLENKTVTETLKRIDDQLIRIRTGKGIGMFATAAYFIAPSLTQARIAASTYKAVVSGSSTNIENSALNLWTNENCKEIIKYLRQFQNPIFKINNPKKNSDEKIITTTPAVLVTSDELAISMGLPRNKINGVPVRDSVSFERNIIRLTPSTSVNDLNLGNIYYLDHEEKNTADLNSEDLTMHCFVTGTTGSGKSNAIYNLLEKVLALKKNIRFMVIEPAKGDYKTVFGHRPDVYVYGTNNEITKLIRINPFRFRQGVHVLEHIDYLISIFKVCWPMEAAMPSVLKQAVERAYKWAGWNLKTSKNIYSKDLFPNFRDVLDAINQIMDETNFSAENKGNYKGALCTRLQELMTGLNEKIFVSDDLSDEQLFQENVIIDLSRLGSDETKSLLMGLLIIRLREFRQSTRKKITEGLQHITVIEEAHNLLKRTSTEQSVNTANMTGKAVEMISNSLAEMRSSGEGFIIVDQSPSMVDLSAIRNTNTKIVLRLPETADREIVGRAISLDPLQISELAKIPTGVAAVYQNDWLGTALVKIPYFKPFEKIFCDPEEEVENGIMELIKFIALGELDKWLDIEPAERKHKIDSLDTSGRVKFLLNEYAEQSPWERPKEPSEIVFEIFNTNETLTKVLKISNIERMKKIIIAELVPSLANFSKEEIEFLIRLLLTEQKERDESFSDLEGKFIDYWITSDGEKRLRQFRKKTEWRLQNEF